MKRASALKVKPANSNIVSQAQASFSGRLRTQGITVSVSGTCTTMTGQESIHNVTATTCVLTRRDLKQATFRDAAKMTASVARSI